MNELARKLEHADSILLTTHSGPDGDGLGCVAALGRALSAQGKRVLRVIPDPLAERYRFLDPDREIRDVEDVRDQIESGSWDLALVLDTHQWELLRSVGELLRKRDVPTFFLDHHPMEGERPEVYGDTDSVATGMLVYEILVDHLGWPITPEIATALYLSISFDTNSFKYLRSQPEPLRVGSELVRAGVDTTDVYRNLFASNPLGKARILGWVLSHMQFSGDGQIGWVSIPHDEIEKLGVERDDLRDCVTQILEIDGVEVAACLKEMDPRSVKISLRSKGTYPINEIAKWMGGGGHKLAAGCEYEGPLDEAWKHLSRPLEDLLADRLDLAELEPPPVR